MKPKTHIKLGTEVTDTATKLPGMLTHLSIEIGGAEFYAFQPRGLNPETGLPIKSYWIAAQRVAGDVLHDVTDLPIEVLGTQVEDRASGFNGMAISITLHINGCVHVYVKPAGKLAKSGETVDAQDFDIRRLVGEAVPVLTAAEKKASERKNPSPASAPAVRAM